MALPDPAARPKPPFMGKFSDLLAKATGRAAVIPVLRLHGVIGGAGRFSRGMTDAGLADAVERAFKPKALTAVALSINSPGGSPAQSAMIAARIRRLADERKVPVYAFCEDVAASGGYWLATAADRIYADANSIVGSIGVISAGFGFTGLIEKLGVERRMHTAGERKSLGDPFAPEREEDVARILRLQGVIHERFKQQVRGARGDRLKLPEEELFSGEVWTGVEAAGLGLVDGVGHLVPVMRAEFGEGPELRVISARRSLLQRLGDPGQAMGRSGSAAEGALGAGLAAGLVEAAEERALWARFGL